MADQTSPSRSDEATQPPTRSSTPGAVSGVAIGRFRPRRLGPVLVFTAVWCAIAGGSSDVTSSKGGAGGISGSHASIPRLVTPTRRRWTLARCCLQATFPH
jgi:hypothetical protein